MSDKTRICTTCDKPKPDPDGFPKNGKQCKDCLSAKARKAYHLKNGAKSAPKAKSKKATKIPAAASLSLDVDACFGFEATVTTEGFLQVQQRNSEGEVSDTLVMSRTEFRQLVDKFTPWAAA